MGRESKRVPLDFKWPMEMFKKECFAYEVQPGLIMM